MRPSLSRSCFSRSSLLLGVLLLAADPAQAQKSADTLRISWREAVLDPDPYHNALRNGLVLAHQAWDGLIWRDPTTLTLKPLLATAWRFVDDTTLDFDLRPDATFQNGDKLTSADVVYTVQQALADPDLAVPSNYAWLAGAEALDPTHVRLHLKRVFPAALEYIALAMPILPAHYRQVMGKDGYSRHPIGAGPYRITTVSPELITLDRYDGYYPGSPKGQPTIAHLVIRQVPSPADEIADLMQGRADWIWSYAPEQSAVIAQNPGLQELRMESMRIGYLQFDAAGRSDPHTPFTDVRVRQAAEMAVDRAKLSKDLLAVGARVADTPCFATQFGCDQAAAVKITYDPARARALLAEAGYPNGFDTELVSYVLPEYAVSVAADLAAIGIRARISQLPLGQAIDRAAAGTTPLFMGSWGSYSINDVSAILPYFFGGGDQDAARNPELRALIEQGGGTISPDRRRQAYSRAIRLIGEQALFLPLNTYVTTYAFSRTLNFHAGTDELPRFFQTTWR